jgi:fructose-1,6-bisphosphatase/sedoheptulose 1,7-bisphosphatase-like protein
LQSIANQLPNAFTDNKKIIKSHIPATNTATKIEVPVEQSINIVANESKASVEYLVVQMIRFTGRERHKEMKLTLLERPYPKNMQ